MPDIVTQQLKLKKFFLWTGMIFFCLVAGTYFLMSKIDYLANQIQDKKSQIQALKDRETNINRLQENYYQIEEDIPIVTAVLPDEENIATFATYLENLSKKNGVNLELVFNDKLNSQIEQNKYLVFNLGISGSGEAIREFWKSLESGPYFVNVTSFSLSTVDGLGSDTQLKLTSKVFTNDPYKINQ